MADSSDGDSPTRPAPHPATVRTHKTNADGSISPFSIEQQWTQIEDWYQFLESDKSSDFPVLDSYNEAWEELDSQYAIGGKSIIERGRALRRVSGSPMSTFFYFVDMGFYPPPELLLAMLDCWETYTGSAGSMTLEEAFFEKPRKGAGNYAKRYFSRFKKLHMQFSFGDLLGQGMTRTEAAEAISQRFGGKPDADSVLRMCRGIGARPASKRKEEK